MCWCSHPTHVCTPDQLCHEGACVPLCSEYPLLNAHGCLCEDKICQSQTGAREGECSPIPQSCTGGTAQGTAAGTTVRAAEGTAQGTTEGTAADCACDSHMVCKSDQACHDMACPHKCPVSPLLATDDCFCHGNTCNSTHVCHQNSCTKVATNCNPENVTDTNCVCKDNMACLDHKICLEGACVDPKPACLPLPFISPAGGCICTLSKVCQGGQTCHKEKNTCTVPATC